MKIEESEKPLTSSSVAHHLGARRKNKSTIMRPLAATLLTSSLLLALLEIACHTAFSNPQLAPSGPLLNVLRAVNFNNRDIIQYDSKCAEYDSALTYRLRPGSCTFSGVEFQTEVRVNAAGLRDDNISLEGPEIIVLGDSHAMGWGVEQEATFAQIIEHRTGRRVLNAAISSYGTAREMLLLRSLDRSNLKALIIQHCPNDFAENLHFVSEGFKLQPMTQERYELILSDMRLSRRYFPGKFVFRTLNVQLARRIQRMLSSEPAVPDVKGPAPRAESADIEADIFLKTIFNFTDIVQNTPVVIVSIDAYKAHDRHFLSAVQRKSADSMTIDVHISKLDRKLTHQHFFRLDDHLSPEGHQVVAEELIGTLRSIYRKHRYGDLISLNNRSSRKR